MLGLCLLLDDDMGVDRGESEKYLEVVDVATHWALVAVETVLGRKRALARVRTAGLEDMSGQLHNTGFVRKVWLMCEVQSCVLINLEMRSLPIPAGQSDGT